MNKIKTLAILFLVITSVETWADEAGGTHSIQVIVSSQSELTSLSRKQVMSLFLGRARSFPNGGVAKAFDNEIGSTIREQFFEGLTGKSISDIDAYWARLRYSGRASPPKVLESMAEILKEVSQNKSAIAYVQEQDPDELAQKNIIVVHAVDTH